MKYVREIYKSFQLFSAPSGLKASLNKSLVYFGGVCRNVQNNILKEFQLLKGDFPFKYLGVPLSTKKLSVMHVSLYP